jgi:hypothetical protein
VVLLHITLYWIPRVRLAGLGLRGLRDCAAGPPFAERAFLLAACRLSRPSISRRLPSRRFQPSINVYEPVLAVLAAGAAVLFGQGRWRTTSAIRSFGGSGSSAVALRRAA